MNTHGTFAAQVNAYLDYRRQAGFALKIEGGQLERFARFADHLGHRGPLTVKLAKQWALASKQSITLTAARRIEVLRPFARYCHQFDPATEIPPRGLFGPAHRRLTPHIYGLYRRRDSCFVGSLCPPAPTGWPARDLLRHHLRADRLYRLADFGGRRFAASGCGSGTRLTAHSPYKVWQVALGAVAFFHDRGFVPLCA